MLITFTDEAIVAAVTTISSLQKNMMQVVKKEVVYLKKFFNDDLVVADLKLEKFKGLIDSLAIAIKTVEGHKNSSEADILKQANEEAYAQLTKFVVHHQKKYKDKPFLDLLKVLEVLNENEFTDLTFKCDDISKEVTIALEKLTHVALSSALSMDKMQANIMTLLSTHESMTADLEKLKEENRSFVRLSNPSLIMWKRVEDLGR